ncbi:MAG TPA: T9SS type A sorting domain-containing protein [Bacteroidales bacterium]
MKKTLTLTLLLLTVLISSAQILPNPSFEVWEPFSGYEDPQSWNTPNQYTSLIGVTVVSKSTDAYSGDYSAMLETKNVLTFKAPGLLTLADFTVNITAGTYTFSGGIPLTDKVNKMTGMFKYSGANGDSASVMIISFRHPEGQEIDTVGIGYGFLHDASDWSSFTVNMYPMSDAQPDTFNVIIMSSGSFDLNVGSVLYVDDLSLETVTGIINLSKETTNVKVYPNPVSDFVKFELENDGENLELSVFDNAGRQVERLTFSGKSTEINLGNFPAGVYSYRITDASKLIGSGSFVKK